MCFRGTETDILARGVAPVASPNRGPFEGRPSAPEDFAAMARPKKNDAVRDRHVRFRLTEEEWATAEAKARGAGLSVPLYLRQAALSGKVRVETAPATDFAALQELNRIGVNLNQLVRAFHATGRVPPRLAEVCEHVEAAVLSVVGGET